MYLFQCFRCLVLLTGLTFLSACQNEFSIEPAAAPVFTLPDDAPVIAVNGTGKFDRVIGASTMMCWPVQLHVKFSDFASSRISQELLDINGLKTAEIQVDEVMVRVMYHTTGLSKIRRAMEVRVGLSAAYSIDDQDEGAARVSQQELFLGEIESLTDCRPDPLFAEKALPQVIAAVSEKLALKIKNTPVLTN